MFDWHLIVALKTGFLEVVNNASLFSAIFSPAFPSSFVESMRQSLAAMPENDLVFSSAWTPLPPGQVQIAVRSSDEPLEQAFLGDTPTLDDDKRTWLIKETSLVGVWAVNAELTRFVGETLRAVGLGLSTWFLQQGFVDFKYLGSSDITPNETFYPEGAVGMLGRILTFESIREVYYTEAAPVVKPYEAFADIAGGLVDVSTMINE